MGACFQTETPPNGRGLLNALRHTESLAEGALRLRHDVCEWEGRRASQPAAPRQLRANATRGGRDAVPGLLCFLRGVVFPLTTSHLCLSVHCRRLPHVQGVPHAHRATVVGLVFKQGLLGSILSRRYTLAISNSTSESAADAVGLFCAAAFRRTRRSRPIEAPRTAMPPQRKTAAGEAPTPARLNRLPKKHHELYRPISADVNRIGLVALTRRSGYTAC
jgi:hypothetical protein